MNNAVANIEIERVGVPPVTRKGIAADNVLETFRGLEGETDVTITISRESYQDKLLIAVTGSDVFLAREQPDGLFQFAAHRHDAAAHTFMIGGQEAHLDGKYVMAMETAACVINEWLEGLANHQAGYWEPK